MTSSPHHGPDNRTGPFESLDLSGRLPRLTDPQHSARSEAESRFQAHLALEGLPHDKLDTTTAQQRYGEFLANLFKPQRAPEGDIDVEIVAACLTPERDVLLTTIRDRSTGDLLLPRPDDILRLEPIGLIERARRYGDDSFCGVLFEIRPTPSNYLVEAVPVVLPSLLRREALDLVAGRPDSLVTELVSRYARQELSTALRFRHGSLADSPAGNGLTLFLTDERNRSFVAHIVNVGGGLLHEVEYFLPVDSDKKFEPRGTPRPVDLLESFKRRHTYLEYDILEPKTVPRDVTESVRNELRKRFEAQWRGDWSITCRGAARDKHDDGHLHIFVSLENARGHRVMPALHGDETLETRKLCGFLVHVDPSAERSLGATVRHALGMGGGATYRCDLEALVLSSKFVAHEIERLAHEPGRSIFEPQIRTLIEADLATRGLEAPTRFSVPLYRAFPSQASKLPLRAVLVEHLHGRHLVSIAYDEKSGTLHPDTDIKVEGFFPRRSSVDQ